MARRVLSLCVVALAAVAAAVVADDAAGEGDSSLSSETLVPFHLAVPVHSIAEARAFYGGVLGFSEGRSSPVWVDWNFHGSQFVTHFVAEDYRGQDYFNGVDGDQVPVPHYGAVLPVPVFHALAARVREAGVSFVIEPRVRFEGKPGEQWTMFFKDPSGNNLEFKGLHSTDTLFAKQDHEEETDGEEEKSQQTAEEKEGMLPKTGKEWSDRLKSYVANKEKGIEGGEAAVGDPALLEMLNELGQENEAAQAFIQAVGGHFAKAQKEKRVDGAENAIPKFVVNGKEEL